MEGKLVPIDRGVDEAIKDAEGEGRNVATPENISESSFEELLSFVKAMLSLEQYLTLYLSFNLPIRRPIKNL